MLVIEDDETPLLVDISLCLNGDAFFPWLRECNTVVMTVGYLDIVEMVLDNVSPFKIISSGCDRTQLTERLILRRT
jgi:hypothetical protein